MRVHHLNCTSMCPPGGRFIDGRSRLYRSATLVSHCLLVEAPNSLVLVDTGLGLDDVHDPGARLSAFFRAVHRPRLLEAQTAVRQVEALGYSPRDVRHVVLTHLDFDHAGGLDDFPAAAVHLLDAEEKAAARRRTPLDRMRYRPEQWASRPRWVTYPRSEGEPWFGFECVRRLAGLPPGILLVPLPGHSAGHAGIAVEADGGWLLHAGDAYFHRDEVVPSGPRSTPGLRAFQRLMARDQGERLNTQARLRDLARDHEEVAIFCSHDSAEFEILAARPAGVPAQREREISQAS
jgi:glyoxylase-like metal-dependent hydrolase (beta-lactamase superfamily II)